MRDYRRAAKRSASVFSEFSFESIFRLILPSIFGGREAQGLEDVEGLGLLADEHLEQIRGRSRRQELLQVDVAEAVALLERAVFAVLREVLTRGLEELFSSHTAVDQIGHTVLVAEEEGTFCYAIAVVSTILDVSARVLLLSLLIEHIYERSILRLEVDYEAEVSLLRIDVGAGEGELLSEGWER